MKITKTQLKQIIKEELSSVLGEEDSNPQALYDQMLSLERKYYHHFSEFDKLGADKYNELISLRNKMHKKDSSYDNYGKFQQTVRKDPFGVFPQSAHKIWNNVPPSPDVIDKYKGLENQFQTKGATSQTDAVYGRRRLNVVHKDTGTVVSNTTNTRGSLGT